MPIILKIDLTGEEISQNSPPLPPECSQRDPKGFWICPDCTILNELSFVMCKMGCTQLNPMETDVVSSQRSQTQTSNIGDKPSRDPFIRLGSPAPLRFSSPGVTIDMTEAVSEAPITSSSNVTSLNSFKPAESTCSSSLNIDTAPSSYLAGEAKPTTVTAPEKEKTSPSQVSAVASHGKTRPPLPPGSGRRQPSESRKIPRPSGSGIAYGDGAQPPQLGHATAARHREVAASPIASTYSPQSQLKGSPRRKGGLTGESGSSDVSIHHHKALSKTTSPAKFFCGFCMKVFVSKGGRDYHMLNNVCRLVPSSASSEKEGNPPALTTPSTLTSIQHEKFITRPKRAKLTEPCKIAGGVDESPMTALSANIGTPVENHKQQINGTVICSALDREQEGSPENSFSRGNNENKRKRKQIEDPVGQHNNYAVSPEARLFFSRAAFLDKPKCLPPALLSFFKGFLVTDVDGGLDSQSFPVAQRLSHSYAIICEFSR